MAEVEDEEGVDKSSELGAFWSEIESLGGDVDLSNRVGKSLSKSSRIAGSGDMLGSAWVGKGSEASLDVDDLRAVGEDPAVFRGEVESENARGGEYGGGGRVTSAVDGDVVVVAVVRVESESEGRGSTAS